MTTSDLVLVKRFLACMAGSVVLAIMVGAQEGTQTDYAFEVKQSLLHPRIVAFLVVGVVMFLAITFWPASNRSSNAPASCRWPPVASPAWPACS